MKTKHKIAIISIVAVLVLVVIGLAVGLVLVAQQATMNNSMTISYQANNVDATITATGMNYANATGTSTQDKAITIGGTELTEDTTTFSATQTTASDSVNFDNTDLTATGRAVYTFAIKNTANANNTKPLRVMAIVTNATANDNITIKMGTTEANATNINSVCTDIGGGQAELSVVVVVSITDATIDVDQFKMNLTIKLGYEIEDDVILNIVNENNIESNIVCNSYQTDVITYNNKSDGDVKSYNYNLVTTDSIPDFDIATWLDFTVVGSKANYNIVVRQSDGTSFSILQLFDGSKFEDGSLAFPNTFAIGYDGSICMASALAGFDYDKWQPGTVITITITPAI